MAADDARARVQRRQGRGALLRAARRRPRPPHRAARRRRLGRARQARRRLGGAAAHARGDPRRDVHGQGERDGGRDAGRGRVHGRRRQGDGDPAAPGRHAAAVQRGARGGRRSGRSRRDPAAGRRGACRRGREAGRRERHPRRHRLGDEGALRDPGDHRDGRQRVRADSGLAERGVDHAEPAVQGRSAPRGAGADRPRRQVARRGLALAVPRVEHAHRRSSRRSPRRRR